VFGKKSEKLLILTELFKVEKSLQKDKQPHKRLLKIKSHTAKSTKEHELLS
jgi:hypothetical protein